MRRISLLNPTLLALAILLLSGSSLMLLSAWLAMPAERPFLKFYLICIVAFGGFFTVAVDSLLRRDALAMAAAFLAVFGWVGVMFVVFQTNNTTGPLWLFFFCWTCALTASTLPWVRILDGWLHKRGWLALPSDASVLLRRSVWFGIFGAVTGWLLLRDTLNPVIALLLLTSFIGIEFVWEVRERTRWQPRILED